jgi:hypothetical protein
MADEHGPIAARFDLDTTVPRTVRPRQAEHHIGDELVGCLDRPDDAQFVQSVERGESADVGLAGDVCKLLRGHDQIGVRECRRPRLVAGVRSIGERRHSDTVEMGEHDVVDRVGVVARGAEQFDAAV